MLREACKGSWSFNKTQKSLYITSRVCRTLNLYGGLETRFLYTNYQFSRYRAVLKCLASIVTEPTKILFTVYRDLPRAISHNIHIFLFSSDLKEAIRCIHKFSRHCMNFDQRRHFQKLFRGTGQMVHELCQTGPYQEGMSYLLYLLK